jgi:hypothetical protein
MNVIVGALLPCTVVVVEFVVVVELSSTTLDGVDATVERPADVRAVTNARMRWSTSAERTP